MDFNYSGIEVFEYLLAISFIIFGLIVALKYLFLSDLLGFSVNKNVFKFRRTVLLFSFSTSFLALLIVFNWTVESNTRINIDDNFPIPDEIEIDIPITRQEPKKIPPPPSVIEMIPDKDILEDEQPEFQPVDIDVDDIVEVPPEDISDDIPKQLPVAKRVEEYDDIVDFVEEMPLFPGCADGPNSQQRQICSTKKLYEYIYSKLRYPEVARATGIEGKVTLKFAVDKTGAISRVKILRDIGGGCGDAASRVVLSMKDMDEKWIPGKQAGRPVSVWFTLPVVFKLSQ